MVGLHAQGVDARVTGKESMRANDLLIAAYLLGGGRAGRWVYAYPPRRGRTWLACKSVHFDLKSVLEPLILWSGKLKACFAFPRE